MILSHLSGSGLKLAPGYAQLLAIKILHHDNFLPSSKLVPPRQGGASAFLKLLLPGEIPGHLETLYRDRTSTHENLYLVGKKHAIPSLHRDKFPAKEPGHLPGAVVG